MAKKKSLEIQRKEAELIKDYARWHNLYENGGQDPFYSDGCNLNLIRNHIIFDKRRLDELEYFPDAYNWELPDVVPNDYMARPDYIRERANDALEKIRQDENYKYIVDNYKRVSKKVHEDLNLEFSYRFAEWLEKFIRADDLVNMRLRGVNGSWIFSVFKERREQLEEAIRTLEVSERQFTIFDYL